MNTRLILGALMSVVMAWLGLQSPVFAAPPVDFPNVVEVAGQKLALNGTGTRFKAVFRVYEAGLYTPATVHTAEEFFALKGPTRLHLVARRDINANELARMLVRGVSESNPADQVRRQLVGLAQVGEIFSTRAQLRSGESFGFDYAPGVGTSLLINGKVMGDPVRDPAFFAVVMRLWLGPAPVDARLKEGLLGRVETEVNIAAR